MGDVSFFKETPVARRKFTQTFFCFASSMPWMFLATLTVLSSSASLLRVYFSSVLEIWVLPQAVSHSIQASSATCVQSVLAASVMHDFLFLAVYTCPEHAHQQAVQTYHLITYFSACLSFSCRFSQPHPQSLRFREEVAQSVQSLPTDEAVVANC